MFLDAAIASVYVTKAALQIRQLDVTVSLIFCISMPNPSVYKYKGVFPSKQASRDS